MLRIKVEIIECDNFPESGGHTKVWQSSLDGHPSPALVAFEFGQLVGHAIKKLEDERGLHHTVRPGEMLWDGQLDNDRN